jgi:hypothetical protein
MDKAQKTIGSQLSLESVLKSLFVAWNAVCVPTRLFYGIWNFLCTDVWIGLLVFMWCIHSKTFLNKKCFKMCVLLHA